MRPNRPTRRTVLRGIGVVGALSIAGCSGSGGGDEPGDGGDGESSGGDGAAGGGQNGGGATPTDETGEAGSGGEDGTGEPAGDGCTPGHTSGDPPCQQVADDAETLTGFDASGTIVPATFDYPCGWTTGTTAQYEEYAQANATRSGIGGEGGAYVDVQLRFYYEPVGEGFLEETKQSGNYDEMAYEYDGGTRTAIVSSKASAAYGTVAHAVVPSDGSLVHVELISTFDGADCQLEPRPDYGLVREMAASLEPNPDTSFTTA
jgi:hypothetical protein